MGIYTGGTFRVGGAVPKNFSFSSTTQTHYTRARQMWDDRIDWETVKARVAANTKGSQTEALEIKNLILKLEAAINGEDTDITEEEIQMITENMGTGHLAQTLLSYISPSGYKGAVGFSFEKHIDELIQMLYQGYASYRTGSVRAGSPIQTALSQYASADQIASLETRTSNSGRLLLTEKSAQAFWDMVDADIRQFYKTEVGRYEFEIKKDMDKITDVIVRQAKVDQKIDISVPSTVIIESNLSPSMNRLAQLLRDRTFSLKNYNAFAKGIHIGDANEFRRMSSFYFFATNSNNFADICTFVFSTRNSKDATVQKYVSWVRILYELMGTGQLWDGQSGRLVDYIIVNLYNRGGAEGLIINSTLEYLKNMPQGNPSFLFNGDNSMNITQLT